MDEDTKEQRDRELVRIVRGGDAAAREAFLRRVTETVRSRVARVLSRASRRRVRADLCRSQLLDLMQDVFVVLLEQDAKVLAAWEPARGLSLEGFVGLVAEREALAFLRSGRRSAWAEDPSDDVVDEALEGASPESRTSAKEQLKLLFEYLSERLSPQGALVFEALYVTHTPLEDVCARFSMSPVAVYSFRARLKRLVDGFRARVVEPVHAPLAAVPKLSPGSAE